MTKFNVAEYVHQSNLIEGIDDEDFDYHGLLAWDYLKKQDNLSHIVVGAVQKTIVTLQDNLSYRQRGLYRDASRTNVTIGGKLAPDYHMVKHLMENWLLDYGGMADNPLEAHVRFEKIHPFADGNGRTGRMLLWWHELKLNKTPTLFYNKDKFEKYYILFK